MSSTAGESVLGYWWRVRHVMNGSFLVNSVTYQLVYLGSNPERLKAF